MVDIDGRILRLPECKEHYVHSEDENLGAMMLAIKTENATAHTVNNTERLNPETMTQPDDTGIPVVESFFESSSQERNIAQDETMKSAEMVDFEHTANTAKRSVTQDKAPKPSFANTAERKITQDKALKPSLSCKGGFAVYDFASVEN